MLPDLLNALTRARVLVVGDAMLDRYWHGGVERISPEAPVPVVTVGRCDERPGGAANVARNVRDLGARCTLLSITGDDREADKLEQLLDKADIGYRLYRDKLINTIVKLRVISRNQQLLRIDFESPPSKDARVRLLDYYLEHLSQFDVVIVSDYGKGGLGYVREMVGAARDAGLPVIVDPKGDDYSIYRRATLVTPNRKEFEQIAGRARDDLDLERRAAATVAALELDGLLITRGEEGMTLVERDGRVLHVPARVREVFDVTGAGDSVIAAVACTYAVGGPVEEALRLASIAAGIVVGKLGAATATPDEIRQELSAGGTGS
ncbi:heptose 1-phosphate adenyltransferase [Sulfurifustis variabilis]|uniref:Heptose 1-phosphate adenyltransferase n=1 Tax=Sulfurifustis variabilis TaxID=1675686 RepID=A0A1B4V5A1_9GAMM|nr:D-glycero-beta-D-manno-heptose-7-phosphate kinase [Sulfurifustis variabilis]BAU48615.1 heptose 1-phosphate adenyltransferase [Sulfurifustis variabilis]